MAEIGEDDDDDVVAVEAVDERLWARSCLGGGPVAMTTVSREELKLLDSAERLLFVVDCCRKVGRCP